MIYNVYCMRDQMTGFMQPTFEINDNVAQRNFSYAINRKDSILYANPKHFDLYKLGTFDTETGELSKCEPEIICTGLSVFEGE